MKVYIVILVYRGNFVGISKVFRTERQALDYVDANLTQKNIDNFEGYVILTKELEP